MILVIVVDIVEHPHKTQQTISICCVRLMWFELLRTFVVRFFTHFTYIGLIILFLLLCKLSLVVLPWVDKIKCLLRQSHYATQ